MKRPGCLHTEGGFRKDATFVDQHDCDYVDKRNALIDAAERHAFAVVGQDKPMLWSREFMLEMDRLARVARLVRP